MSSTTSLELFHQVLDTGTADMWAAIFDLPFVREVGDGTLDERCFRYFITQDLLYLDEFARVLAAGARFAEDPENRQMLLEHAANVHVVEQSLHASLGQQLGITPEGIRAQEPAPVTVAYTDHLLKVAATGPLIEVVGAVLPCYWVYQRVGERLSQQLPGHPLYDTWIQSYGSPEFEAAVLAQLRLVDTLAATTDDRARERTERWFRRSLRYEWMFWDQAYRRLDWPA